MVFEFETDQNYSKQTFTTIKTVLNTTPGPKVFVVFLYDSETKAGTKIYDKKGLNIFFELDTLNKYIEDDKGSKVIYINLNSDKYIDFIKGAIERKTIWSELVALRLYWPNLFKKANIQINNTDIKTFLHLDSDLYVFDDLYPLLNQEIKTRDLLEKTNEDTFKIGTKKNDEDYSNKYFLSADLCYIQNYESYTCSGGVVLMNLKKYKDPNPFIGNFDNDFLPYKENIDAIITILKELYKNDNTTDTSIQRISDETIKQCIDWLLESITTQKNLDIFYKTYSTEFDSQFAQWIYKYVDEKLHSLLPSKISNKEKDTYYRLTNDLVFNWLMDNVIYKTNNALAENDQNTLEILRLARNEIQDTKYDKQKILSHCANTEEDCFTRYCRFVPQSYNFIIKNIYPNLDNSHKTSLLGNNVKEYHELLDNFLKEKKNREQILQDLQDMKILHFDGCIKPWSERGKQIVGNKEDGFEILEFYNKILDMKKEEYLEATKTLKSQIKKIKKQHQ